MKRFLNNVLIWFVVGMFIAYASDLLLVRGIKKISNGGFGVHRDAFTGHVNAEFLVSGSSRALANYDTPRLSELTNSEWFNIGLDGEEPDVQFAYLSGYMSKNKKPKMVVYNIDPWGLGPIVRDYDNIRYVPFLDNDALYGELKAVDPSLWRYRYIPMYKFFGRPKLILKGIMGNVGVGDRFINKSREKGYGVRKVEAINVDVARAFNNKRTPKSWFDYEVGGVGESYLQKIIELCESNNVPLIFVVSPIWKERELLATNRRLVNERLAEMCRSHNIPFRSFLDSPICDRVDCFADSVHLNQLGARLFADELDSWLQEDVRINELLSR